MITVRCKQCGKELISTSKIQFCGCPNQMRVVDDKVGAVDLDKVVMVSNQCIKRKRRKLIVISLKTYNNVFSDIRTPLSN